VAGYSGTPLIRKLGIKPGHRIQIMNAPPGFLAELGSLPEGVLIAPRSNRPLDLVLMFATSASILRRSLAGYASRIALTGCIWVAWPKKSSGVHSSLSFGAVQTIGLETGLVDVKICAINEIWSGLKFVIRLADRDK
jgi:hypothetical protein